MENKTYKILNLINEYEKYFNKNIIIIDEKKLDIDFQLNNGKLGHLMGLHHMDLNKKSSNAVLNIINNNLCDQEIFETIYNIQKKLGCNNYEAKNKVKTTKERCDEIDYALKNLHNAYIVKANLPNKSEMSSINFIIQMKDNKYLQIGVAKDNTNEYYLETFIIRKDKRYFDDVVLNSKILGLYERNKNNNIIPFSFDKELNIKLEKEFFEDSKNFDYQKTIQEYNKEKVSEIKNKGWNKKNIEDLER